MRYFKQRRGNYGTKRRCCISGPMLQILIDTDVITTDLAGLSLNFWDAK